MFCCVSGACSGFPPGDRSRCTDGLVRLERSPLVEIDSWEFERAATAADTVPQGRMDAVAMYGGDVLSSQFAYDDPIAGYRRALRRTFVRLATTVLEDPPLRAAADDLVGLARRAWAHAPEDDLVCRLAAGMLTRLGYRAEAAEMVEATARSLDEMGYDGEAFKCSCSLREDAASTAWRLRRALSAARARCPRQPKAIAELRRGEQAEWRIL